MTRHDPAGETGPSGPGGPTTSLDHDWAVDLLVDLYRPDRYTVDEHGWAPWMGQVADAVAEFTDAGWTSDQRLTWALITVGRHLIEFAAETGAVIRHDRFGLVAVPDGAADGIDHGQYLTVWTRPGRPDVHLYLAVAR